MGGEVKCNTAQRDLFVGHDAPSTGTCIPFTPTSASNGSKETLKGLSGVATSKL